MDKKHISWGYVDWDGKSYICSSRSWWKIRKEFVDMGFDPWWGPLAALLLAGIIEFIS